ncbi:unnamed protein product [Strongylus vulgaris]|uniref:Unconventional myosin-XV-like domain-containing protein n=1 Tax=Strongylus vulgaris TaxID=40348 RepID=A0A3P7JS65_STRVU|nr:unnamed protein product [Strongylus vulgaris]
MLRPEDRGAIPRPLPRSPSPLKSPAPDRKLNGLTRLPQDAYREPVVQNTIINSEHPNPRKLKGSGMNLVKEIHEKEQEALRKINERMKNLPPPVDEVRIYIPRRKKPVTTTEAFAKLPDEPPQVVFEPDYVVVEKEEPQNKWIFEGEVERPVETVERVRSTSNTAQYVQQPIQQLVQQPLQQPVQTPSDTDSVASNEKPAVRYVKQPWKLTIRKEMFHPKENLDDVQVINQVFAQIISDCRKGIAYRIRSYDRDQVVEILKASNVPPDMLNRQSEIPLDIKVAVIEAARKWPLYFAQVYEVRI